MNPAEFYFALREGGISFFSGVPDSLLKNFCAYVSGNCPPNEHVITANEGNAVALASGFHMSTGRYGAVYMQNSGLGNSVNPIASLADELVYSIPMLLIIGWRGEPGVTDEPQHAKQGLITHQQLDILGIEHRTLSPDSPTPLNDINELIARMKSESKPVALVIKKGFFPKYEYAFPRKDGMRREDAIAAVLNCAQPADLIVSTTGKASRELFELRKHRGEPHTDFLTVGSMGHTSSIALGAALGQPQRTVICLDGDGSLLMHLGACSTIGKVKPSNFLHILLNNYAHESVGGQPTASDSVDFSQLTRACGYTTYAQAKSASDIEEWWRAHSAKKGPHFLEVVLTVFSRADLGRPTSTPIENKTSFMKHCDEQSA